MKIDLTSKLLRQGLQLFACVIGAFSLVFVNTQDVHSAMQSASIKTDQIIVEHLRLHVDNQDRQAWLAAERGSWEQWLSNKRGFLGRKLFWDPLREEATVMITWASFSEWKSIPQGEIDAVQERFEQLARQGTGNVTGNPFPLIYEAELFPQ